MLAVENLKAAKNGQNSRLNVAEINRGQQPCTGRSTIITETRKLLYSQQEVI